MNVKEKQIIKSKLGLTIQKIIKANKAKDSPTAISSLRKLAASSGVEYAIIQLISSGKRDPQWSTVTAIVEGLGLSMTEFSTWYDDTSESSNSIAPTKITSKKKG